MKFASVRELAQAYGRAELTRDTPLNLDNDTTNVYAGPDDDAECVFEMHPQQVLEEALDLLGIPWEGV